MSQLRPDHDHHQGQDTGSHDGSGHWVDDNSVFQPSHHSTPVHEYNSFAFTPLQTEPEYTANIHPPRTTHQQLRPLIMPQWPSMLTSQSTYVPPIFPTAPVPVESASTLISAASTGSRPASTPRKTLTDVDRRRICLYREEHPNVKQTEIGAIFGVERSTVSKVLRNKEKYIQQDDSSRSPIKRPKGKFSNIERALPKWARNHQKQGLPLSDAMIKEKARFFATTVGSSESHLKTNSSSWLEKSKYKNNLKGAKLRKSSFAEDAEAVSSPTSKAETPNGVSPTSPEAVAAPSPVATAAAQSDVTPRSSSSSSPSQDDARRALELVLHYFQQQPTGLVEPQEYVTIGKLMEKLKLHPQHHP